MPVLDAFHDRWAARGVQSVFIYTHEAHPGEQWPAHESLDQKRAHAAKAAARWDLKRPMLVDDLAGTVHRAYGGLPNMAWIVGERGRVFYRANWTDARTLDLAVQQLLWEGEQRDAGHAMMPFRAEWAPQRVRDRVSFVAGLQAAGPRAITEFMDAARAAGWPRAALQELDDAIATLGGP